jgi:hypothetical protein
MNVREGFTVATPCHRDSVRASQGWAQGRFQRGLEGRQIEAGDRGGEDVVHPGPDAGGEAQVVDRRLGDLVVEDALHLVQERLALLHVELFCLPPEDVVDLGQ